MDVTDSMLVPALSGRALVKRKGDAVQLVFDELRVEGTGTKSLIILPDGYRPFWTTRQDWYVPSAAISGGSVNITPTGYVIGYSLPGSEAALTASIRFDTEQPFPSP